MPRRTADIVSGFNGGNWGNEFMTFHVGYEASNDSFNQTIERMRIGGSGHIGINGQPEGGAMLTVHAKTTDQGPLRVKGYGAAHDFFQLVNNYSGNYTPVRFLNAGGAVTVGTIGCNDTSTSYNTSSDYRLKEDFRAIADPVGRLMQLMPVNFAWKLNGERVDGFVAHEAAEVVPEAVTGEKDAVDDNGKPIYQGIDQSKLVPLLTAALQDALRRIEALEARA